MPVAVVLLVTMEIIVLILPKDLMEMSHGMYGSPERITSPSDVLMLALYRQDELGRDAISIWRELVKRQDELGRDAISIWNSRA